MKDTQALHSRIAPTPSGYLHIGNAFSFLYTFLMVAKSAHLSSTLRLRIDDADTTRSRKEYLEDIFYSLDWLGIQFSDGPSSVEDFHRHYSQQLRFGLYHEAIDKLRQVPNLIYACECSRSQIKKHSSNGLYPMTCRSKSLNFHQDNVAWRIHVPNKEVEFYDIQAGTISIPLAQQMGDFVIRRKDGLPAYQIASLVDDLTDGINFIVRGQDLLDSTAAQVFLANQLAASKFSNIRFCHHPLILEKEHQKLSKSHQSLSLKDLRKQWPNALRIHQLFAKLIGIPNKITHLNELIEYFNPEKHQLPSNYYLKDLLEY